MPDLLDRIRKELGARIAELRPLVEEYGRLDAALGALGDVGGQRPGRTKQSTAAGAADAAVRKPPARSKAKRARRGAHREAVLQAASERPGATRGELAAVTGIDPNTLSALLGRLVKAGDLRAQELPIGQTGYVLPDPPSAMQPAQPPPVDDAPAGGEAPGAAASSGSADAPATGDDGADAPADGEEDADADAPADAEAPAADAEAPAADAPATPADAATGGDEATPDDAP